MLIKKYKGCLVTFVANIDKIYLNIIPEEYKLNQQNRDNNKYHVTIISSDETNNLDSFEELTIEYDIFNFGLCKSQKNENEIYYFDDVNNDLQPYYHLDFKTNEEVEITTFTESAWGGDSVYSLTAPYYVVKEVDLYVTAYEWPFAMDDLWRPIKINLLNFPLKTHPSASIIIPSPVLIPSLQCPRYLSPSV